MSSATEAVPVGALRELLERMRSADLDGAHALAHQILAADPENNLVLQCVRELQKLIRIKDDGLASGNTTDDDGETDDGSQESDDDRDADDEDAAGSDESGSDDDDDDDDETEDSDETASDDESDQESGASAAKERGDVSLEISTLPADAEAGAANAELVIDDGDATEPEETAAFSVTELPPELKETAAAALSPAYKRDERFDAPFSPSDPDCWDAELVSELRSVVLRVADEETVEQPGPSRKPLRLEELRRELPAEVALQGD